MNEDAPAPKPPDRPVDPPRPCRLHPMNCRYAAIWRRGGGWRCRADDCPLNPAFAREAS